LENYNLVQGLPTNINLDTADPQSVVLFRDKFLPLLKIILPACCVEPKVSQQGDDESLGIDEIALEDLIELFGHIFDLSGLTKAAEDARKKSQEQTSLKQSDQPVS
jgi:hypothetical protein